MTRHRTRPALARALTDGPPLMIGEHPEVIMGIDPSLTATGIALIQNGRLIHHETMAPPKGQDRGVARLNWFYHNVGIKAQQYSATAVGIEGYAFGARNSHAHALGELGGVIRLALDHRGILFHEVPPTTLKKFVTGKGNAEKAMVSKEMFKRFGVDLDQNDQVDAAGLAIVTLAYLHPEVCVLTGFQKEALKKMHPGAK